MDEVEVVEVVVVALAEGEEDWDGLLLLVIIVQGARAAEAGLAAIQEATGTLDRLSSAWLDVLIPSSISTSVITSHFVLASLDVDFVRTSSGADWTTPVTNSSSSSSRNDVWIPESSMGLGPAEF
jgi:hypothetical protein